MTIRDLILHHLEHTFEKEAWQPSLVMAIEGLMAVQAMWKPSPARHSIWQIVRHSYELERRDWRDAEGDESAWRTDVEELHRVSTTIAEWASGLDDQAFLQPFPGEEMPTAYRLLRMATHDIYHAGQIRYLRALQGAS